MPLPKLNAPTYQITIPSTGVTTQYRPFFGQGTKHLMMPQESEDLNEIANTVSTLVDPTLQVILLRQNPHQYLI